MILLDTHVLLWLLAGDSRLSAGIRERIGRAQSDRGVRVSAVTFWEVAMLVAKNRVDVGLPPREFAAHVQALRGMDVVPVSAAIDAGSLPAGIHGDPADRMIVATARALGCVLLTVDAELLVYAAAGHVQAQDARL